MKIDAGLMGSLDEVPKRAKELEAQGFDGLITAEMSTDPFFPLLLAAEHTERIELMTSIAGAFAYRDSAPVSTAPPLTFR